MDQLVNVLNLWFSQQTNPGEGEFNSIRVRKLPLTGNNLHNGEFFCDAGTVKCVLKDQPYAPTLVLTLAIGSVTVTVS